MANILIVDDSVTIAKFVEEILLKAGHSVSLAVDAVEADLRLSATKFDLIILDIVMPGKNGFQLCRELKSHPQFGRIPIIIMSTKNTEVDRYWGRKQGADEYLGKPCESGILLAAVRRLVPPPAAPASQSVGPQKSAERGFFGRFGFR